jgi:hypothetical protein
MTSLPWVGTVLRKLGQALTRHHDWWHRLPPMSFGTAAALTFWPFALGVAITLARAYLGLD